MARIVRRSDNEPLKTLERPSSASSQTTAHIINSCFKEILIQTPLDPGAVNNLAVSRRGESIYHDEFVDGLKKVCCRNSEVQNCNVIAYVNRFPSTPPPPPCGPYIPPSPRGRNSTQHNCI